MKGIIVGPGGVELTPLRFDNENNPPAHIGQMNNGCELSLDSFKRELLEARATDKTDNTSQKLIIDSIAAKDNIHQEVGRNRAERRKRNKLKL